MNDLNSILIEGVVSDELFTVKETDGYVCHSFSLCNERKSFANKGCAKTKTKKTRVQVMVRGVESKVEKVKARVGHKARIVGRIVEDKGTVYIEAEYIEYLSKPKGGE
jgi:hypothetical protein